MLFNTISFRFLRAGVIFLSLLLRVFKLFLFGLCVLAGVLGLFCYDSYLAAASAMPPWPGLPATIDLYYTGLFFPLNGDFWIAMGEGKYFLTAAGEPFLSILELSFP